MRRLFLLMFVMTCVAPRGAAVFADQTVSTGTLQGQVLTPGVDPQPVRRALVTVNGDGLPHGRTTVTDDDGGFTVAGLPPGRFVVTATKAAHLPAAYGAAQPGRSAVAIQLVAGEQRTGVTLVMARAAVIAGVLRFADGTPAPNVDVGVFRLPPTGDDVHMTPAGTAITDDRGAYRVYGLPPGDYVVVGAVRRLFAGNGDAERWTAQQIDATLRDLERPGGAAPVAESDGRYNWAPVFFPGSASAQDAVPIRVRVAEVRDGVDFVVSMTRMVTVEGILVGGPDEVSSAQFFFNRVGVRLQPLLGITPVFSTRMTPAGKAFTYAGLSPGRYSVTAHVPGGDGAWAKAEFHVTGGEPPYLTLSLQPAVRLSGRVVFEGSDTPPAGALRGATIRPTPANGVGQAASSSTRMGNPFIPAAQVNENGTFDVRGIVPETVTLTLTTPNASGWSARSMQVNGRDVLDEQVLITGDLTDVLITMTNQPTKLSGRIVTTAGAPGASVFIAVFPQDTSLWHPRARRITSARADTDGRWHIDGLPPGDYFVVALTDLATGELHNTALLEQLAPAAMRLSLAPGEHKAQDLQIGR
jgi:uncharacterized protein (DUF2141 family)